jgi:RES domain
LSISTGFASILMPNGADENIPIVKVESEWFRLIPSRFPPVSLYGRVIANDRTNELAEVENLTNPRLRTAKALTDGIEPVDPTSPRLQNWNLAPFTYSNPDGTRFFRNTYNCLELAEDIQTALAISVARREAFLRQTNEAAIGLDMRVLKTPVNGRFVDLREQGELLTANERWDLGEQIIRAGHDGVLFRGPERPSASCVGIVKETTLGRSQQTRHFRFLWDGTKISTLYAFDDATEIDTEMLCGVEKVIAA